jgi:hypothetical protein
VTRLAGEGRAVADRADHAHLPVADRAVVRGDQGLDRAGGGHAGAEQGQRLRTVGQVGVRLGGNRTDVGQGGRDGRADAEELAGHGHSQGRAVGGSCHDRKGHGATLAVGNTPGAN